MSVLAALKTILEGRSLTGEEAAAAMGTIMDGEATAAQIAALLTALRMKGETAEEIAGFARTMREHAVRITPKRTPLVDVVGTGGDKVKTFNVSTAAAFVAAGAGAAVAKHGNRAVTSRSGAADVLEALGVNINLAPEEVARCIDEVGIGFLFARTHHPAMRFAAPVRAELGIRTVFNVLGPLTNPAGAEYALIGVFAPELTEVMAKVLGMLGARQAFVVHGMVGLDEWSTVGATRVSTLRDGKVTTRELQPEEAGISSATLDDLRAGDAEENAATIVRILEGETGPRRDIVVLNAGAALAAASEGMDVRNGIARAAESIDSGAARAKLEAMRRATQGLGG